MPVSITVVTPSYNQASYLEQTLRSVISQRDQIHEYFVYDGASSDDSVHVIEKYAGQIDYWESRADEGQSNAIEKGFSRATGEVLCWLNSDDVFLPGALQKVREAFDRHPEWDCLTGNHVQMDHESKILNMYRIPAESPAMARWGVVHVAQPTWFFRKSLYERIGGIRRDLHCVMDADLWARCFDSGARWGHIPEFLAGFRRHPLAKTSSWGKEYEIEEAALRQRYPAYYGKSLKLRFGRHFYRTTQILSGRFLTALAESRRYRGRTLAEVFGDWNDNLQSTALPAGGREQGN
jgi:glycosyltransferase involved in cell wall biosynthesis